MRQTQSQSLGDALKNAQGEEGKTMVFTKDQLKKHLDKCLATKQRVNEANADHKGALDAAEKAGIPRKELKFLMKTQLNPITDDFKATVNIMQEMLGQPTLFDFAALDNKH